jgi:hypothetical protein
MLVHLYLRLYVSKLFIDCYLHLQTDVSIEQLFYCLLMIKEIYFCFRLKEGGNPYLNLWIRTPADKMVDEDQVHWAKTVLGKIYS